MFDRHAKVPPELAARMKRYAQMVAQLSPKSEMGKGLWRAFWVGGTICCLGQALLELARGPMQMSNTAASMFCAIVLVGVTAVLTGLGVWDRIGQYAGAGAFVPITGFANAMVSPAMEFRQEGMVLGLGARLFTIAGPVLVWGVSASVAVGLLYAVVPW